MKIVMLHKEHQRLITTVEGHYQLLGHAVNFIPLGLQLCPVVSVAFNRIANSHHELRVQQIELIYCPFKDAPRICAPGTVTNHGKLKIVQIIPEILGRPGLRLRQGCLIEMEHSGSASTQQDDTRQQEHLEYHHLRLLCYCFHLRLLPYRLSLIGITSSPA